MAAAQRPPVRRRGVLALTFALERMTAGLICALLLLAGCQSTPTPAAQFDQALQAWNEHQYARAFETARAAQESAVKANNTALRDRSAYLAGLAAFKMDRLDDASRSFVTARTSADRDVRGKATAMMGAIALEQGRWEDAATLWSQAAELLTGTDAEHARQSAQAARAHARSAPAASTSGAPSTSVRRAASPEKQPGPAASTPTSLTIVAGTYSSEVAARQRAAMLTEPARRYGLTPPQVVQGSAPDRQVWIVEIGSFTNRAKAEEAIRKLPVTGAVVAPSQKRPRRRRLRRATGC